MPTPGERQSSGETENTTPHPLENVVSFEEHMKEIGQQEQAAGMNQEEQKDSAVETGREEQKDSLTETMGQYFDLENPYRPNQFSKEKMKQFFPGINPQDPINDWIKKWQDPRQAFDFLEYASDFARDFIFALHKDLIYEDDEGKPHMRPTIDIDGKVYAAKEQPANYHNDTTTQIIEFSNKASRETGDTAPHSPGNIVSLEEYKEKKNQEKQKDSLTETMGQYFDLEEPYRPNQFSKEEMEQFFPGITPEDPINDWIKKWQDPRQAFDFLEYASDFARDFIFALHKDLIYEDDEGRPHMRPTIDIDGNVYVTKEQPANYHNDTAADIIEFPDDEQANAL